MMNCDPMNRLVIKIAIQNRSIFYFKLPDFVIKCMRVWRDPRGRKLRDPMGVTTLSWGRPGSGRRGGVTTRDPGGQGLRQAMQYGWWRLTGAPLFGIFSFVGCKSSAGLGV